MLCQHVRYTDHPPCCTANAVLLWHRDVHLYACEGVVLQYQLHNRVETLLTFWPEHLVKMSARFHPVVKLVLENYPFSSLSQLRSLHFTSMPDCLMCEHTFWSCVLVFVRHTLHHFHSRFRRFNRIHVDCISGLRRISVMVTHAVV